MESNTMVRNTMVLKINSLREVIPPLGDIQVNHIANVEYFEEGFASGKITIKSDPFKNESANKGYDSVAMTYNFIAYLNDEELIIESRKEQTDLAIEGFVVSDKCRQESAQYIDNCFVPFGASSFYDVIQNHNELTVIHDEMVAILSKLKNKIVTH